eukprot:TRINITY_DN124298_c0_g1_i1.p1 TRINITY_DN124298_c0_g1~~TRINITY_DN124298_c0_g1_i1.p1  ORF type:complete len:564 (-),score=71.71 TRINITY_DN124298_c0_g1_i1:169-1860(-)
MALRGLFSVWFATCAVAQQAITVVDMAKTSLADKIAVQTCAGLFNRNADVAGAVYVLLDGRDLAWLESTEGIVNPRLTPATEFVAKCMQSGTVKGYLAYNASSQPLVLPNIITLAGVLDAVPLEASDPAIGHAPRVFDAVARFAGFSAYDATLYMYNGFANRTTTMAKMNPGLDTRHPLNPPLTRSLNPGLIDFVVKERLFNFFLNEGCIPLTKDHGLMEQMVKHNPWPKPIVVYGYDDTFSVEGDLFEAETNCVKEHNMGQVASSGFNNLAFFSRKPSIREPLLQNPDRAQEFNKSRTYITLIVGDGDNLNFVKGSRRDWMLERVSRCKAEPSYKGCFPLVWTLSPRTLSVAPDMARWYFNQSYVTKSDYFVLPPSGDTYSYPSLMQEADQEAFVANTEADCHLMNTSGTVAWEWFGTWSHAMTHYFPKYVKRGILRSAFAVNVPFNLPEPAFWDLFKTEHYKVLGGSFVLFRPREWRGASGKGDIPFSKSNMLTAKDMAAEINGYPRGTVSHIYMTSDGGAKLSDFYDLVALLDDHVSVVSHNVAANMALAAASVRDDIWI